MENEEERSCENCGQDLDFYEDYICDDCEEDENENRMIEEANITAKDLAQKFREELEAVVKLNGYYDGALEAFWDTIYEEL